jgi:lactobin A/cerein 7B family class IIb bacteriocin
MKNLQNFGVQELNAEEIREIDGGIIHWFWPIAAGAVVVAIISDWKNFKAGLFGRPPIN